MTYIFKEETKPKSKTALIMCTYIRLTNMPKILNRLKDQTNKDFDFYISNNSINQDKKLIAYFAKYGKELGFNSYIKNYYNEYKMFSRFYVARELAEQGYERVIFMDDDQVLPKSFIQDCYDQYNPEYVKSFYAHKFDDDYWDKVRLVEGEEGNYAGTGGLICSAKIFLEDKFFDCPKEYHIIDDLWLSYYILKYTGYKIRLLKTDIQFIYDDKATFVGLEDLKRNFSTNYIINNT
jgi:GT2 family glycosyltransferase